MKKLLAFILVLTVFLSIQITAFAYVDNGVARPPRNPAPVGDGYEGPVGPMGKYFLYNAEDEQIDEIYADQVLKIGIDGAAYLNKTDSASFVSGYRAAKAVKDKHLRFLQWIDIPKSYKTDDLAYMTYFFECEGKDVEATVNGNPIEVSLVSGIRYCAKMTEFGTLAVYDRK